MNPSFANNEHLLRQLAVRPAIYATDRERWAQFPWGAYDLKPILYGIESVGSTVAVGLLVPEDEKGSLWFLRGPGTGCHLGTHEHQQPSGDHRPGELPPGG
jgi:hypothetical protein